VRRLGVQHAVWRARVLDAWQRAGFGLGQTILDLGCGPGYAALDLADVVGATGRVIAIDRSRRFLDVLESRGRERGIGHITAVEADLDDVDLDAIVGPDAADGVWCRWVAAFVHQPHELMQRIQRVLKPGGVYVSHEYFEYGTWRMAPPSPEIDEFVHTVIRSWRDAGGEPNIGLEIPSWLESLGLQVTTRPIVDVIGPGSATWQWPRAFIESGLARLSSLGLMDPARAAAIWSAFLAREQAPHTRMVTPALLETIAKK